MKKLIIVFFSILLSFTGKSDLGQSQANILFIFADDWGYGDLSCHDHAYLNTPIFVCLAEKRN